MTTKVPRQGRKTKIPGHERRASIIRAARNVFVQRGFDATTTRALAEVAGISEALLFKHFPSKQALYAAILQSAFEEQGAKILQRLQAVKPSTEGLVFLVHDLVSHILAGKPDEEGRELFRLIIRSLLDEGEFTRLAIQGGPALWVRKVKSCIDAAKAAGDMLPSPAPSKLAGWFVHELVTGIMLHGLPAEPVIDYGVGRSELIRQVVWFCLRGMGLKEGAIRRSSNQVDGPSAGPPGKNANAR